MLTEERRDDGPDAGAPPARMHSTNLVGIPTGLLASTAFNAHPLPLHINGAREMNPGLFRLLDNTSDAQEAAQVFEHYMAMLFELNATGEGEAAAERRRFRSSYLRLLQGWGFDSNNAQGAVLKGWAESRFGLLPNFHKQPLGRFPSEPWMTYVEEKMNSRFHNNSINLQLDLLFEYSQWAIARFWRAGQRHVTLYRGANDWAELGTPAEGTRRPRRAGRFVTHLNNLVSFSFDRARAEEFGDWIFEASVPLTKIVFFNDLLSHHALRGEAECIVIGGDYEVEARYD